MRHYTLFLIACLLCSISWAQSDFYKFMDAGCESLKDGDLPNAKRKLERALTLLPDNLPTEDKLMFFNNLGVLYYQTGDYKKGIRQYMISVECAQKTGVDSLIAQSFLNLGIAYKAIGDTDNAVKELTLAAPVFEREGNLEELASTWNAIGNIENDIGNFDKALEYHWMALNIRKKIGYDKGIADSYHNIGSVYKNQGLLNKSSRYLEEALRRKRLLDNQSNLVNTLSLLGQVYVELNQTESALPYLEAAYSLRKKEGMSTKAMESLFHLGTYYATTGEKERAFELFSLTTDFARSSDNDQLLYNTLTGEIALLKATRNNDSLIDKYDELIAVRERILEDENRQQIARLEARYDLGRKRKTIQIQQLRNQQLSDNLLLTTLIVVITVFALIFILWQNRKLANQKKQLALVHTEHVHRTKNYFMILYGMLTSDEKEAHDTETLRIIQQMKLRLRAMWQIQDYLLEGTARNHKYVPLIRYLRDIIDQLTHLLPKDCKLELDLNKEEHYVDYAIATRTGLTLNELICNSIKYGIGVATSPTLQISVQRDKTRIEINVKDNGPGIQERQLQSGMIKGQGLIAKLLYEIDGKIDYSNNKGCIVHVSVNMKKNPGNKVTRITSFRKRINPRES